MSPTITDKPTQLSKTEPSKDLVLPATTIPHCPVDTNYHGDFVVDFFQWLEYSKSPQTIEFIQTQNARVSESLDTPTYHALLERLTKLNFDDNIMLPKLDGVRAIRHKTDADHPRGQLQVCSQQEFFSDPYNPPFKTVLDIDSLCKAEGRDWMFAYCTFPDDDPTRLCLALSDGGADRIFMREYNTIEMQTIAEGFFSSANVIGGYFNGSSNILHFDDSTIRSVTNHALEIKYVDRTTMPNRIRTVYRASPDRLTVSAISLEDPSGKRDTFILDFKDGSHYTAYHLADANQDPVRLPLPAKGTIYDISNGWLIIGPRERFEINGTDYHGGLVAFDLAGFLATKTEKFAGIFTLSKHQSITNACADQTHIYASITDNVISTIKRFKILATQDAAFSEPEEVQLPGLGVANVWRTQNAGVMTYYADFLTPPTYSLLQSESGTLDAPFLKVPQRWDVQNVRVQQEWATSKDGTRVPFFVVDARTSSAEPAPTMISGYGGFSETRFPFWSWPLHASWLEFGNVYILANLRGGNEFGPAWAEAAKRENKNRAYEDMIAVAERTIELGISTSANLGLTGASNGGLMALNVMLMRPDLFAAVHADVPLTDMLRYHRLPPGAAWIAEYGSADVAEDYAHIKAMSPYHQVRDDISYPPLLITTSTSDDRVHPSHGRKLAAKMISTGHENVFFYERPNGGHGRVDHNSWIEPVARQFSFFQKYLSKEKKES